MNIVKEGLHVYAVRALENNDYFLSTEYPMITHNDIMSLLSVRVLEEDGERSIRYEITGQSSLLDWGETNSFGYQDCLLFLESIVRLFDDLEEHMLSMNQISFAKEHIFIDSQKRIHWIYLPIEEKNILDGLKNLFLWILSVTNYEDKRAYDLMHRTFQKIRDGEFSKVYLEKCLLKERNGQPMKGDSMEQSPALWRDVMNESSSSMSDGDIIDLENPSDCQKGKGRKLWKRRKSVDQLFLYLKYILSVSIMVLDAGFIFLLLQLLLMKGVHWRIVSFLALAGIGFLAVAVFLFTLLKKSRRNKKNLADMFQNQGNEDDNSHWLKSGHRSPGESFRSEDNIFQELEQYWGKKHPTVIYSEEVEKRMPTLYEESSGRCIRIQILPFYIGGEDGLNQLSLKDRSVSRQHAVIIQGENGQGYRIEDLHSRKGTKVNGKALLPDIPMDLEEGSRISLGNVVFRFGFE